LVPCALRAPAPVNLGVRLLFFRPIRPSKIIATIRLSIKALQELEMGKAIGFLVFFAFFIVFAVIKTMMTGAKAAYEAVFDPNAKDARVEKLVHDCMLRVSHTMHEKYTRQPGELKMAILQLTLVVQSMILEAGYKVEAAVAANIVCKAIVIGGHASDAEIKMALA
jgi:hypothetical protein